MQAGKTSHLFQALERNESSHRLALALDNELVVPKRDSV